MKHLLILTLVITSFYAFTGYNTVLSEDRKVSEYTIPEMIEYYGKQFGVQPSQLLAVAKCESNLKQDSWGDHHNARGIFQFWQGTWDSFSNKLGEKLDRESAQDQVKLAAFAFSKGYQNSWTCWSLMGYTR